jgi:energy-coupling factor transporter transmembrane protein EcfT
VSTLLYCEGSGVLHRTHPLTKLCLLLWATVAAFTLPWEVSLPASMAMIASGADIGGGKRVAQLWFATLAPLALALIILHGLMRERPRLWEESASSLPLLCFS